MMREAAAVVRSRSLCIMIDEYLQPRLQVSFQSGLSVKKKPCRRTPVSQLSQLTDQYIKRQHRHNRIFVTVGLRHSLQMRHMNASWHYNSPDALRCCKAAMTHQSSMFQQWERVADFCCKRHWDVAHDAARALVFGACLAEKLSHPKVRQCLITTRD